MVLSTLKELGARLALDDFGTGYSSASYVRRFPIDTLKIDQSFVRDLTTHAGDASVVNAVINMAKSLNMGVVAEGRNSGATAIPRESKMLRGARLSVQSLTHRRCICRLASRRQAGTFALTEDYRRAFTGG